MFKLQLQPGITLLNFSAYLLATFTTISLFVFLNASQAFILSDILHIPTLGNISGLLTLFDEFISIPSVILFGILSDTLGRRLIYSFAFFCMSLSLFLYTYAQNIAVLLAFRFVFAVGGGAASSMLTAVLADYSGEGDRGKLSGLVGLVSGLGALLGVFVFLRLPLEFERYWGGVGGVHVAYGVVGSVGLVVGLVLMFGLQKDGRVVGDVNGSERKSWCKSVMEGVMQGRDGRVLLGYVGGFLARADSVVVTVFIPLFVQQYYIDNGLCSAVVDSNEFNDICRDAYVKASILSGIAQTSALVFASVFGILADKVSRPMSMLIGSVVGVAGLLLIFTQTNPFSGLIYVAVCMIGIGEISMIVVSLSLVTGSCVSADIRGSTAGVYSLMGSLGIMFCSGIGGWLFDVWSRTGPFLVLGVFHVFACLLAFSVVMGERKGNSETLMFVDEEQERLDA